MRIKKLSIIVLMITLILILTNKSKAVENIEEGKFYIRNEVTIQYKPRNKNKNITTYLFCRKRKNS